MAPRCPGTYGVRRELVSVKPNQPQSGLQHGGAKRSGRHFNSPPLRHECAERWAPFVDEKKLAIWLQELAIRLSHAAVILVSNHEGKDRKLLIARAHYLDAVNTWTTKYFPKN